MLAWLLCCTQDLLKLTQVQCFLNTVSTVTCAHTHTHAARLSIVHVATLKQVVAQVRCFFYNAYSYVHSLLRCLANQWTPRLNNIVRQSRLRYKLLFSTNFIHTHTCTCQAITAAVTCTPT